MLRTLQLVLICGIAYLAQASALFGGTSDAEKAKPAMPILPPPPLNQIPLGLNAPLNPILLKDPYSKETISSENSSSNNSSQATNIANSGSQTYYAGVIQIAAGVTQVSRAAQDRSSNGSTEQNRQELVTGLTNLSSGSETVYKAREMVAHANSILGSMERMKNAGQAAQTNLFSLSFDRNKAGDLGNHVLDKMEQVTEIPAETLVSHVNDDQNIYDLAANAKGLSISSDELATAAETALAKAGKNPNPEIANGAKLTDLMKDLDMFMAKKEGAPAGTQDASAKRAPATAQAQPEQSTQLQNASPVQPSASKFADADNPYLDKRVQVASNELQGDFSIFQMVSRQYRKRDLGLNVRSAQ